MTFVPVIVSPPPPPSPRTRELARQLGVSIEQFRREHPDIRPAEIRQALALASSGSGSETTRTLALAIGVLITVLLVALLLFFRGG